MCGVQYMKSDQAIRAAERPIAGPFRAVTRILGCVEKAWVMARLLGRKDRSQCS